MTAAAWVSIGIFLGGIFWSALWYLMRRRSELSEARILALELAVSGENGVRTKLMSYVTQDALEQRMVSMADQMAGIKEEGERREERILEAIREQTKVLGSALSDVRSDLRSQAQRIDGLFGNR